MEITTCDKCLHACDDLNKPHDDDPRDWMFCTIYDCDIPTEHGLNCKEWEDMEEIMDCKITRNKINVPRLFVPKVIKK